MSPAPCPPTRTASLGCGSLVLRLLAPFLLVAVWCATPSDARADGCAGCPTPTLEDLQKVPGFKLEKRPTGPRTYRRDYYALDEGECGATLDAPPDITIEDAWLALRASGEVWSCPHSKSVDTIVVEAAASDSTAWSFKVRISADLGPVGAAFKREVEMGNTTGRTVTEVTRISKTITPTYCHRIQWRAYFQVAKVKATGMFTFRQHWAWWTKNLTTGSTQVHAKGDVYMECGSGRLEMERQAPIAGHFELSQSSCGGPECGHVVSKQLGMYPPWPPPAGEPQEEEVELPGADDAAPSDAKPTPDTEEGDTPEGEPSSKPTSSADLGEAPTGPAIDPHETTP